MIILKSDKGINRYLDEPSRKCFKESWWRKANIITLKPICLHS